MHVIRRRGWEIPARLATPERLFFNRRAFLAASGIAALGISLPLDGALAQRASDLPDPTKDLYPVKRNDKFALDRPVTDEKINTSYNNFYEFGMSKSVAKPAQALKLRPWTVKLDGMVEKAQEIGIDDLVRKMPLEERLLATAASRRGYVMRYRVGDELEIVNGRGRLSTGRIAAVKGRSLQVDVQGAEDFPMPAPRVIIAVSLTKGHAMNWLIEKLSEMGGRRDPAAGLRAHRCLLERGAAAALGKDRRPVAQGQPQVLADAHPAPGLARRPHRRRRGDAGKGPARYRCHPQAGAAGRLPGPGRHRPARRFQRRRKGDVPRQRLCAGAGQRRHPENRDRRPGRRRHPEK